MYRSVTTEFTIDDKKALRIAEKLQEDFYERKGFFMNYRMPEYVLPRNLAEGSREHALYLTYVISIDYMTNAFKLWQRARQAYSRFPERFEPAKILELATSTTQRFVREIGARFPKNGARTWQKISQILAEKYNSDPRNLTPQPMTIVQIMKELKEFPYLRGPKLSNFYLRVMGETELFKISDFDQLDIPVDIQVARFTIYTGVLKLLSDSFFGCVHRKPIRGLIEEAWRTAAKQLNIPPWKLDEPIWTIGSKLCSKRKCSPCPVADNCDNTKNVVFRNANVEWVLK